MRHDIIVYLFLVGATLVVFWQVANHEFVNFDDDRYVTENPHVQAGVTRQSIIWAFTTDDVANWHPLTWLSHMLDCQLYGVSPKGHHLTNLLFHLANTLLLFFVFKRMTGALWRSGFVAALFAVHPLHVESVAWVAERKDVLSTFFWMLTIWAYLRYIERPAVRRYVLTLFSLTLGLMAKPMLVTLPLVLLLLDYWPLDRLELNQSGSASPSKRQGSLIVAKLKAQNFRLLWEKVPLFALAAISSIVTFVVQRSGGSLGGWNLYPLKIRIANALVSYVSYIGKMIWPQNLAVYYPYPGTIPIWQAAGAGLLLGLISMAVLRVARRHPYLAVGWLWYLGTLVPVIGLVQMGAQAMADRYTYVPLIGLFIMLAWGIPHLVMSFRYRRIFLASAAGTVLAASLILTWTQLYHWKNSATLFQQALKVTANNYLAYNNLGNVLDRERKVKQAIAHYVKALQINPNFPSAHNNLGNALAGQGKMDEATAHYVKALQINPNFPKAHYNLGNVLAGQGKMDEAVAHYSKALQLNPDFAGAHNNLANVLEGQGKIKEAVFHFSRALEIKPDFAEVHFNLGNALARQGKLDEAQEHFSRALEHRSEFAEAHNSLGVILARKGRLDEAIVYFTEALRLKPGFLQAQNNLGIALHEARKLDEARKTTKKPED
jgi:tetratricopeptide (TPR) repeat protein